MPKAIDLATIKFGRLLAKKPATRNKNGISWECICDCGNTCVVNSYSLRSGKAKSCGCLKKEIARKQAEHARACISNYTPHGDSKTAEYKTWRGMKTRCYNENDWAYDYYGDRGIEICEEWLNSYPTFLRDMGRRPSAEHSIDRIDVNGPYAPWNCRWATRSEQNKNRRPFY